MSRTNCVNCGAAKDTSEIKCPFCGTTYLDLTAIDFESGKPVVCQFVLPKTCRAPNGSKIIMSMLAIPQLGQIEQDCSTMEITGGWGQPVAFMPRYDISVGASFKPVSRKDGSMMTFEEYN